MYQIKGFYQHPPFFEAVSYVDKVGLKLTVYPWMDELELILLFHLPWAGVTGVCCQTWFVPCSGWSPGVCVY